MESWFLKHSYPEHLIETEMKTVKFKSRDRTEKSKSKAKGVPYVVTYHLSLICLHRIVRYITYLLNMNGKMKNVFLRGPIVSFRSAPKFSSCLVRAKLYPFHRKVVKNC